MHGSVNRISKYFSYFMFAEMSFFDSVIVSFPLNFLSGYELQHPIAFPEEPRRSSFRKDEKHDAFLAQRVHICENGLVIKNMQILFL